MSEAINTAVIMAGGRGMRLRPYTTVLPKPLMPLGDMPLIEILIRQLRHAGVRHIVVSLNHLSHLIRAVLDNTAFRDVELQYHYEPEPLGTCGALTLMRDLLPQRFLVVNGDLLSDYPIRQFIEAHEQSSARLSIATLMREQRVSFGVVERSADGSVKDYIEKPAQKYESSIGLYALEFETIFQWLKTGTNADMPDLIRQLLSAGETLQAIPANCTWIDVGRADDHLRAQELFSANPARFLPDYEPGASTARP